MDDIEGMTHDAWGIVRRFASENPTFIYEGAPEDACGGRIDPCGAHRWLQRYDELFPPEHD